MHSQEVFFTDHNMKQDFEGDSGRDFTPKIEDESDVEETERGMDGQEPQDVEDLKPKIEPDAPPTTSTKEPLPKTQPIMPRARCTYNWKKSSKTTKTTTTYHRNGMNHHRVQKI